jgi:hypothetical protein
MQAVLTHACLVVPLPPAAALLQRPPQPQHCWLGVMQAVLTHACLVVPLPPAAALLQRPPQPQHRWLGVMQAVLTHACLVVPLPPAAALLQLAPWRLLLPRGVHLHWQIEMSAALAQQRPTIALPARLPPPLHVLQRQVPLGQWHSRWLAWMQAAALLHLLGAPWPAGQQL